MDLQAEEVSQLLNISEEELCRLIDQGLPVYTIDEQYRFNRQEIEAWLLRQKHLAEKKGARGNGGAHRFSLFRALSRGDVYSDIVGMTKEAVIKATTNRIARSLKLDPEVLVELFMEREELMPTALGHGFAIPHARDFLLEAHQDVVTIVLLQQPIDYGALDGEPVHTLFFLLASDDRRHLGLLSKVAHMSANQTMRALLASKPSKEQLAESVKQWEEQLI